MPRSRGGRSAVSATSRLLDCDASTKAGRYSVAAVPLVHAIATGASVAEAMPSAKNAALRSSRWTCTVMRSSRASASASGVERDPGDKHACADPAAGERVDQGRGAGE